MKQMIGFGDWRLFVPLRPKGEPSGTDRIHRLYTDEGVGVRKRIARRKAISTWDPILPEAGTKARWSLDFLHDQVACGQRFRVRKAADDVTRDCRAKIPNLSISGRPVARDLTVLIERHGRPGMIVSEGGAERTSKRGTIAQAAPTGGNCHEAPVTTG